MTVPELKRAVCPGCGVDTYLHRVEDWWVCPDCKWNDKPPPAPREPKPRPGPKVDANQLLLMVNASMTISEIARAHGVHSNTVKRRMRALGLRSMNGVGRQQNAVCAKGLHALEGLNVYLDSRGGRKCRACQLEYQRERRARMGSSV